IAVTFTVTSTGGTPTGNVTVSDGSDTCTGTVAAGTCSLTPTSAGTTTLTATYAGDANFAGSTSTGVTHTVTAAATTTIITGHTPDPSVVGQAVAVTFTVTSTGGTPTGNVTVSDGTQNCSASVALGNCSIAFSSVGGRTMTASYAGDGNFAGSTSAPVSQTVGAAGTTTTITGHTPDPSVVGQSVTVNFTVTSAGGTPTGPVTVSDGTDTCSGTVAAGTCTRTPATAGTKADGARYFSGSTSAGEAHTVVSGAASQLVFTVQPSNTQVGAIITPPVQVTATDAFGNVATDFAGDVTIAIGTDGSLFQNANLHGTLVVAAVNGVATFSDLSIDQVGGGYKLVVSATV